MPRQRSAITLIELLVIIAIVGICVGLLLPLYRGGSREPARRAMCRNNLRQIGLALLMYAGEHGEYPPAYTVDEQGNRLHSWRTLILPYMYQQAFYKKIDLTKPWDDPANAEARATLAELYGCPSAPYDDLGHTQYLALIGPKCAFTGATPRPLDDLTDALAETLLIVEAPADRAVHWMDPHDIAFDEFVSLDATALPSHPGGFHGVLASGEARFFPEDLAPELRRALATVAGGEAVDPNEF